LSQSSTASVDAPRAAVQQRHHLRGGVGGGQHPARLVAQRHAARRQQRADAAREHAVAGHQRHRRAALRQVRQHAGGGTLGLVLAVGAHVQRGGAARWLARGSQLTLSA
jgi:hypothetical protein